MFLNRDETFDKDAKLVNCFVEKDLMSGDYWVEKRGGLSTYQYLGGAGYGMYNWQTDVYSIFGPALYKNGVFFGTVDATGGVYRFDQLLGTPPKLVLGNGVKAYYTDGTTLTQITDVNFPTSFCKGWVYLDGTLYVMTPDAHIHGTQNLDDPSTWDPLNVIVARVEPDLGVALAKHLTYVIALKQWTSEAFYDGGNPTGSPLTSVSGSKSPYGCVSSDSVQSIDDNLFWMSSNREASPQIAMMADLKVSIISTPPIERRLDQTNLATVASWVYKHGGHKFYGLTIKEQNLTLIYDIGQGFWSEYTDPNGNYWPLVAATFGPTGQHLVQHETNGTIYLTESAYTYPTDDGVLYPVDIYTPKANFGVDRRKVLNVMRFYGDQTPGSLLYVRSTDDDYQSYSNFRLVNMSTKRPILTNCGTFYTRAWHLRHYAATPFRVKSVDLQMDLGTL